jgi:hypothetical protein
MTLLTRIISTHQYTVIIAAILVVAALDGVPR